MRIKRIGNEFPRKKWKSKEVEAEKQLKGRGSGQEAEAEKKVEAVGGEAEKKVEGEAEMGSLFSTAPANTRQTVFIVQLSSARQEPPFMVRKSRNAA